MKDIPFLTALKIPSLMRLLPPLVFGLSVGLWFNSEKVFFPGFMALLYTWFIQIFIVLLNDYADRDADKYHNEHFPHLIDKRVLPLNLIKPRTLLYGGMISGVAAFLTALFAAIVFEKSYMIFIAGVSLLSFIVYSFPPLKLNYRGGGELLEAAGVGILIPLTGFYFITNTPLFSPASGNFLISTVPLFLTAAAMAASSGLKHKPADENTGKKTVAVISGSAKTKKIIIWLNVAALIGRGILNYYFLQDGISDTKQNDFSVFLLFLTLPVMLYFLIIQMKNQKEASIENLPKLKIFKTAVNRFFMTLCFLPAFSSIASALFQA